MQQQLTEQLTFQSRREWMEARRTLGIGSSDAPVILGLSRYQSPYGLYCEKLGLGRDAERDARSEELIAWGNILEEPIAQRYALVTGRAVTNPRESERAFFLERSRANEFMVASVDRRVAVLQKSDVKIPAQEGTTGVLEIKNAHLFMADDWLDAQEPPVEFQVQLQHQLAVTGATWGSIACLIGGSKFVWKDVARDDEFIGLLIEKERAFWQMLLNRTAPPIDGSEHTREAIGARHPKDTGAVIELEPDYADLIAKRTRLKAAADATNDMVAEIDNQLKARIGDNTAGTLRDGTVVTWKWQKRASYTVKETEFRQLRVKLARAAV